MILSLQDAARFLRNAAPDQWKQFTDAFGEYTDRAVYEILRADTDQQVRLAQGRARECSALMLVFSNLDPKPVPPKPHAGGEYG